MYRFSVLISFFLIIGFLRPGQSFAQQQLEESNTVDMVKSMFLYHFASANDWPASMKKGKFVIAILGNPSLYDELAAKYGSKPVGSQTLQILELSEVPDNQTIHILYIDKSRKADLALALKQLKDSPTMIVTHFDGALAQGATVNFKAVNNNIRYELNKKMAEEKKINLGSKIIQWAVN